VKTFAADLHIHTGLSPCASEEMTPPAIVQAASERGLAMIAICDHNAAGNTAATLMAGWGRLSVLAGMEITTAEEVHVVGIFPGPISALAAADEVQETLPPADEAYRRRFGEQRFLNADGRLVRTEPKMLAVASKFDLSAAVALIHRHHGVAIAAHVNRRSFSVMSQLGIFPPDAGFDAIEVFTPCDATSHPRTEGYTVAPAVAKLCSLGLPIFASSDSHHLGDIGRARSMFEMQEPTFDEFVLALRGVDGRGVRCA
jgi:3',5'-nucleoside bisphosphate phosphatase